MQRSFLKKTQSYFHCIMKPAFNHTIFLSEHQILIPYNMQCVVSIQYCCEKVQWPMQIAAFVENKNMTVQVKWRLQVAIWFKGKIFPQIRHSIIARKPEYGKKGNTSFTEVKHLLLFSARHWFLKDQTKKSWRQDNPWNKEQYSSRNIFCEHMHHILKWNYIINFILLFLNDICF